MTKIITVSMVALVLSGCCVKSVNPGYLVCRQEIEKYDGFTKSLKVERTSFEAENGESIFELSPNIDAQRIWCYYMTK